MNEDIKKKTPKQISMDRYRMEEEKRLEDKKAAKEKKDEELRYLDNLKISDPEEYKRLSSIYYKNKREYNAWYYRLYNNKHKQDRYGTLKNKFIEMYGGICNCCGEDNPKFLTLDHVKNDGYISRGNSKSNTNEVREAIAKYDPERYQILCYNCNMGKARNYGVCPHKDHEYITDHIYYPVEGYNEFFTAIYKKKRIQQ
ncbi:MAG: hypothetical protein WC175_05930 [Candidatus Dojkabacteria bacterium]